MFWVFLKPTEVADNKCRNNKNRGIITWIFATCLCHFPLTVSVIHADSVHCSKRKYLFPGINFPLILPHSNKKAKVERRIKTTHTHLPGVSQNIQKKQQFSFSIPPPAPAVVYNYLHPILIWFLKSWRLFKQHSVRQQQ